MSRIVITGDSLSYNRYDYDATPRINAFDCYPDMGSWSFQLRNWLITHDNSFHYASDLLGVGIEAPNRIFGTKTYTYDSDTEFSVDASTLYFQKLTNGGFYTLHADDHAVTKLNFKGNPTYFRGMELFRVDVPHAQKYSLRGHGLFTFNGASNNGVDVYLTGQGSRTAQYFNDNFYDRIGRFVPDILVFLIGSNDAFWTTVENFAQNLDSDIQKTRDVNTNCKIYLLTSPKTDNPVLIEAVNVEMIKVAKKYDCIYVDLFELFDDIPVDKWRYDNVHMTKHGNDVLFHKMKEIME